MKNDTLTAIAASVGVSKATVSRALNHCSGVDSETRERILTAAGETDIPDCAIYSLLPDTPTYFWQEMRRGLSEHENPRYPMKCSVYTRLRDDFTVLFYLRESVRARVLLVAASVTSAIRETLAALLPDRLVLLLSEDDGVLTNGFYLGSDADADGYAMGELYVHRLVEHIPYLLTLSPGLNRNVDLRAAGFSRYLAEAGLPTPRRIEISPMFLKPVKTFPARMASLLTEVLSASGMCPETKYALYTAFGYSHLPLAVEKVRFDGKHRLSDRCALLCHDVPLTDGRLPDGVFAACNQDVYGEGKRAMEAANHFLLCHQYPPQKRIYVPSRITV